MLATVAAATLLGVDGLPVSVEVHAGPGLPGLSVVGLPDASCREARDRARAAILCSGLKWPTLRVTVNLAPSGQRKVGSSLDLAMAVGILAASEQVPLDSLHELGFVGELGLDGSVRPVPGVLCMVDALHTDAVVVPAPAAAEAELPGRHRVRPVRTLAEVVAALRGTAPWPVPEPCRPLASGAPQPDLAEVRGQVVARRALEVSAAGGHSLLLVGPPGAGKTMLAERLPGVLPPLDPAAALEVTRVHSAAGVALPADGLIRSPPLRAPHHGASMAALVGGGSHQLRPGEVSLATRGVLFLDELGEFSGQVLDALRTPLEQGVVRIARAHARATLPARVLLVGAMNPCPCGAEGGPGDCRCSPAALDRYTRRLSGPLLDRFDLQIRVPLPEVSSLLEAAPGEPSEVVARRVAVARGRAVARGAACNADLGTKALEAASPLSDPARAALEHALRSGQLSARGLRRVRSVALTLSDLEGADPPLGRAAVLEALHLRAGLITDRRRP